MSKRIYVASSWRNPGQPDAVRRLRAAGHYVYDFRNPPSGSRGFDWAEIDPEWTTWTPAQFIEGLDHFIADSGFRDDLRGMEWANVFVLLLPCGRSAHLEAGWAIGRGLPTYIVVGELLAEAELMYKLATRVVPSLDDVIDILGPPASAAPSMRAARRALENVLNDTRGFHVDTLDDEIRDELLTRLATAVVGAVYTGPKEPA